MDVTAIGLALSLLGLLISLMALGAKWQERPRLRLRIPEDYDQATGDDGRGTRWRFVQIAVENRRMGLPLRWLVYRPTAQNARIRLEYRALGGTKPKFAFEGRWSGNPEPVQSKAEVGVGWKTTFDPWYIHRGRFIDVAVGQPEYVALAVKVEGDADSYGFTNESYGALNRWRLEEYRLPVGTYVVTATVLSGDISSRPAEFLLHNDGPALTDLWLDLPSPRRKWLGTGETKPKREDKKPLPEAAEVSSTANE